MLFRSENDITPFKSVSAAFKFEDLKPVIEFYAEPKLQKVIGKEMYDELHTAYKADEAALTSAQQALLRHCRNYVVNHAFHHHVAVGSVTFSQNTIGVVENPNLKPASQYKIEELKRHFLNTAYQAEEILLKYLEDNSGVFTTWASSSAYTEYTECFINTADEFSKHHDIGGSRRIFKAIKTIMKRIEKDFILPMLCTELYDQIKSQIKDVNVSAANEKLLPYIRMTVAKFTIAEALYELPLILEPGEGVLQLESGDTQNMALRKQAPESRLVVLSRKSAEIANQQLTALKAFLDANANNYPLYKNSSCYVDPTTSTDDLNDTDDTVALF